MWYPQTSNNCSCVSKNIFCSMHLGKDIWVSWKNNFCWVFADYVSFRFYVKHIWKNIFWAPIPFKRYQNTSGCSTVLYLVVEIQQLVLEIRSFPKVLLGDLKNFSKFTDKHKKQSSRGVLSEDALKSFAKFTEKHLCRSLFFHKVTGWKPKNVRISHWRSSVKEGVFLKRRLVFQNQPFIDPLQNFVGVSF